MEFCTAISKFLIRCFNETCLQVLIIQIWDNEKLSNKIAIVFAFDDNKCIWLSKFWLIEILHSYIQILDKTFPGNMLQVKIIQILDNELSDKIAIVFFSDGAIQILDKRNPAQPYPNFG